MHIQRLKLIPHAILLAIFFTACGYAEPSIPSASSSVTSIEDTAVAVSETSREDITITLAAMNSSSMQDVIDEFNAADNGYKLEVKQYADVKDGVPSDEEYHAADLALVQDLLAGDTIDIICSSSFTDSAYYDILQNKGAFVDLFPLMDQDDKVNTSTVNKHVLDVYSQDGHLYRLPTFYGVETLIGESCYVGNKENWSVDEFIQHWNSLPDGFTFNGSTQSEEIYYVLLRSNINSFIDYENASVHFDSPEFKRLLEFCCQFKTNHGNKMIYDTEAPIFLTRCKIDSLLSMSHVLGDDKEYTFVGYPSENGEGAFFYDRGPCFSICAKTSSDQQHGAWEFIRSFATYEYQKEHAVSWVPSGSDDLQFGGEMGFCINNKAFDEVTQNIIDGTYLSKMTYEIQGESYPIILPTAKVRDRLVHYFESVQNHSSGNPSAVYNIVTEEIMGCLAGEKSVEDTIRMIQSRASIWISEQS